MMLQFWGAMDRLFARHRYMEMWAPIELVREKGRLTTEKCRKRVRAEGSSRMKRLPQRLLKRAWPSSLHEFEASRKPRNVRWP